MTPQGSDSAPHRRKPWWRRWWAITAAVALVLVVVASVLALLLDTRAPNLETVDDPDTVIAKLTPGHHDVDLSDDQIEAVASYVANELGKPLESDGDDDRGDAETATTEPGGDRAEGEAIFSENCASCHD